ncbi:MAG: hypothetical protein H7A36_04235 [Chlamydiales bacterium]|nr:hypothetical protein [Chlamydiales bacterium]
MRKTCPNSDGKYQYGFTQSGLFTLLDKKGEPFYPKVLPIADKVLGNLIWIALWVLAIFLTNWLLPSPILLHTNRALMALLIFNLFFLGCRLTQLLLCRPLRPLFFPPLWMRLTRQIARGADITLLKKHNLQDHPGLLANLALAHKLRYNKMDEQSAENHPA